MPVEKGYRVCSYRHSPGLEMRLTLLVVVVAAIGFVFGAVIF